LGLAINFRKQRNSQAVFNFIISSACRAMS
jgi:hypothetical protein